MTQLKAPEAITTPRLTLRRPHATDAKKILEGYASDPAVTRYLAWPTHRSLADTEAFLAFSDVQWARWPASAYLICRPDSGEILGGTGLDFESQLDAVTGYVLARQAWGQGYATEALFAMMALARSLGVHQLSAGCHPDHHASLRVLEKGGFSLIERRARASGFPNLEAGQSQDLLVYARAP